MLLRLVETHTHTRGADMPCCTEASILLSRKVVCFIMQPVDPTVDFFGGAFCSWFLIRSAVVVAAVGRAPHISSHSSYTTADTFRHCSSHKLIRNKIVHLLLSSIFFVLPVSYIFNIDDNHTMPCVSIPAKLAHSLRRRG